MTVVSRWARYQLMVVSHTLLHQESSMAGEMVGFGLQYLAGFDVFVRWCQMLR